MLKDWKKRKGNWWIKKNISLEIYQDSIWRNKRHVLIFKTLILEPSSDSALAKTFDVKHFNTKSEALKFAKRYMRTH